MIGHLPAVCSSALFSGAKFRRVWSMREYVYQARGFGATRLIGIGFDQPYGCL